MFMKVEESPSPAVALRRGGAVSLYLGPTERKVAPACRQET